jgi:hypothetical protein
MTTTTRSVTIPTTTPNRHAVHAKKGNCQCGCESASQICCQLDSIVRPQFHSGQLLTDHDLNAMLDWAGDKYRLSRYRHGWGVVCGLEVKCHPKRIDHIIVGPGYAVDCCGDDIIVFQETEFSLLGACLGQQSNCADWLRSSTPDSERTIILGDREFAVEKLCIIDLAIRYHTSDSDPLLIMGSDPCRSSAQCTPTRTQESFILAWRLANETDPMMETAKRWNETFQQTLIVIKKFKERFPNLEDRTVNTLDVKDWLVAWIKEHPLHHFCFLHSQIAKMDLADFKKEAEITKLLFWIIQDYRQAFLRCGCFAGEVSDGVPLARIYLLVRDDFNNSICETLAIDPYPPYRRHLSGECWPAPLGGLNLAQFIGRRWLEVCRELDDRGVQVSGVSDFHIPEKLDDLKAKLSCDPFLISRAEEWNKSTRTPRARVVEIFDFKEFGKRVVRICEPGETPSQEPAVKVTKVSVEKSVKVGDPVNYITTVTNTGTTTLKLRVVDTGPAGVVNLDTKLELEPGETKTFNYALPKAPLAKSVTNNVKVTGQDQDGQTVSAEARHTIPIVIDLPDIPGLSPADIRKLKREGIDTVEGLAGMTADQLQVIFPKATKETLQEWISEAKKLVK